MSMSRVRIAMVPVHVRMVPNGARDVKVVVYDYGSDLLGTATGRIR